MSSKSGIGNPVITAKYDIESAMFSYVSGTMPLEQAQRENNRATSISIPVDMPVEEAKEFAEAIVELFQTSCCREHRIEWLAEQLLKLK